MKGGGGNVVVQKYLKQMLNQDSARIIVNPCEHSGKDLEPCAIGSLLSFATPVSGVCRWGINQ